MGSSKTAAAKKASARPPRAGAETAPAVPVENTPRTPLEAAPDSEATLTGEQQPLTTAGDGPDAAPITETALDGEQQPLTQPEHETGLIDPAAESAPQQDANQPTDATQTPTPPPSKDDGAGGGEAEPGMPMPTARMPDAEIIAEAASYQTAPAERGEAVLGGYFTPQPPDVRGKPKRK